MDDIYLPVKDIPPEIIAAAKVLYNWTEMHNVEAFDGFVNRSKYEDLSELYHELILNVSSCFDNETRHQTALRYIKQMENLAYNCKEYQDKAV
jgi:hypothetical protein